MSGCPAGSPLRIKVPATSANLGPGFDSVGLALSFGLTVDVYPQAGSAGGGRSSPEATRWRVETPDPAWGAADLSGLPADESNLIVQTALAVAAERAALLPSCRLVLRSEAPDLVGEDGAPGDLVTVAARLEGHPDNVAPAILGGLVVAAQAPAVALVRVHLPPADIVLCIPDYPLPTVTARAVLPATLPFADAVLAGAGPTVIAFAPPGRGPAVADAFRAAFPRFETRVVSEDRLGATVVSGGAS